MQNYEIIDDGSISLEGGTEMSADPGNPMFAVAFAIITFLIFGIPMMQILHRTGFSRAWILVTLVLPLAIIFLWIYAFIRWPVENDETERKAT